MKSTEKRKLSIVRVLVRLSLKIKNGQYYWYYTKDKKKRFFKKNNSNTFFTLKNINFNIRKTILKSNDYFERREKNRGAFETRCLSMQKDKLNRQGNKRRNFRKKIVVEKYCKCLFSVSIVEKRPNEQIGHILRHGGGLLGQISEASVEGKHQKDHGYNA